MGVSREQAEAHIQIIAEIIEGDVATKQDLKNLEYKLDAKFEAVEHRIVIKFSAIMGAMFTLALGIVALLIKLN